MLTEKSSWLLLSSTFTLSIVPCKFMEWNKMQRGECSCKAFYFLPKNKDTFKLSLAPVTSWTQKTHTTGLYWSFFFNDLTWFLSIHSPCMTPLNSEDKIRQCCHLLRSNSLFCSFLKDKVLVLKSVLAQRYCWFILT